MKNVNVEGIKKFLADAQKDRSVLKRSMKVEVAWDFDEKNPQMNAKIEYPNGSIIVSSDGQPFMGGRGRMPNPMQYCLFGLASCFAGTFALIAEEKNLSVSSLNVIAENQTNFSKAFGFSEEPLIEKVKLTVKLKSKAGKKKIEEVVKLAKEKCPGVYCVTNKIPLETEIKT